MVTTTGRGAGVWGAGWGWVGVKGAGSMADLPLERGILIPCSLGLFAGGGDQG